MLKNPLSAGNEFSASAVIEDKLNTPIFSPPKLFNPMIILTVLLLGLLIAGNKMLKEA
jgi:hypothetical protein